MNRLEAVSLLTKQQIGLKRLVFSSTKDFTHVDLEPRWSFELAILKTKLRFYHGLTTNQTEIFTELISNLLSFYT